MLPDAALMRQSPKYRFTGGKHRVDINQGNHGLTLCLVYCKTDYPEDPDICFICNNHRFTGFIGRNQHLYRMGFKILTDKFPVEFSDHNVPVPGGLIAFHDQQITVKNPCIFH